MQFALNTTPPLIYKLLIYIALNKNPGAAQCLLYHLCVFGFSPQAKLDNTHNRR